jgi:hypothetical protein
MILHHYTEAGQGYLQRSTRTSIENADTPAPRVPSNTCAAPGSPENYSRSFCIASGLRHTPILDPKRPESRKGMGA